MSWWGWPLIVLLVAASAVQAYAMYKLLSLVVDEGARRERRRLERGDR